MPSVADQLLALLDAVADAPRAKLSAVERLVLLMLLRYMNVKSGRAWPSVGTLVAETALGRRTVQRALTTLVTKGILVAERKGGRAKGKVVGQPSTYRIGSALERAPLRRPSAAERAPLATAKGAAPTPERTEEPSERTSPEAATVNPKPQTSITCAKCQRPSTVPFVPTHDRPLLCARCYEQQRTDKVAAEQREARRGVDAVARTRAYLADLEADRLRAQAERAGRG